jgi:membrane associated rhomboid family serine protease
MALPLRDDAPTRRTPWVTIALILVNLVVFLFLQPPWFQRQEAEDEVQLDEYEDVVAAERYVWSWGVVPCEVMSGKPLAESPSTCDRDRPPRVLLDGDKVVWVGLLTSAFLHSGLLHLLGNLLFLWVFGNNVEDRLGHLTYLAFYLVGGVVAALGFVLANQHSVVPGIGASGAIAAVMGAYLVFRPRAKILTMVGTAAFQVVYVPAYVVLGLFFVTQFLIPDDEAIAWEAHAAGMAFGMVAALLLARLFPDPAAKRDPSVVSAGSSF